MDILEETNGIVIKLGEANSATGYSPRGAQASEALGVSFLFKAAYIHV